MCLVLGHRFCVCVMTLNHRPTRIDLYFGFRRYPLLFLELFENISEANSLLGHKQRTGRPQGHTNPLLEQQRQGAVNENRQTTHSRAPESHGGRSFTGLFNIACCLLPVAYCPLHMAYCILHAAYSLHYCLLPIAHCILPLAYYLLPIAYCLLPTAYCLLPLAYSLLPIPYCLLPVAYYLLPCLYVGPRTYTRPEKVHAEVCPFAPLGHLALPKAFARTN